MQELNRERTSCTVLSAMKPTLPPASRDLTAAAGLGTADIQRIVISVDDTLRAEALCYVCAIAFPGCLLHVARSAHDAMAHLARECADLIITGLEFTGVDRLEALRALRQHSRRLFIVSARKDELTIMMLRTARFDGYFDPEADDPRKLSEILRSIAGGAPYLSPTVSRQLLEPKMRGVIAERLTSAELKVLATIANGARNDHEAAIELHLSVKTVKTHRRNLMRKLNVRTSAKLVIAAIHLGFPLTNRTTFYKNLP